MNNKYIYLVKINKDGKFVILIILMHSADSRYICVSVCASLYVSTFVSLGLCVSWSRFSKTFSKMNLVSIFNFIMILIWIHYLIYFFLSTPISWKHYLHKLSILRMKFKQKKIYSWQNNVFFIFELASAFSFSHVQWKYIGVHICENVCMSIYI